VNVSSGTGSPKLSRTVQRAVKWLLLLLYERDCSTVGCEVVCCMELRPGLYVHITATVYGLLSGTLPVRRENEVALQRAEMRKVR